MDAGLRILVWFRIVLWLLLPCVAASRCGS